MPIKGSTDEERGLEVRNEKSTSSASSFVIRR